MCVCVCERERERERERELEVCVESKQVESGRKNKIENKDR